MPEFQLHLTERTVRKLADDERMPFPPEPADIWYALQRLNAREAKEAKVYQADLAKRAADYDRSR